MRNNVHEIYDIRYNTEYGIYIMYIYINALSLMTGYDASAHLSEETIDSSIAAPMATIYTGTYLENSTPLFFVYE
jgi:hypothetical protein